MLGTVHFTIPEGERRAGGSHHLRRHVMIRGGKRLGHREMSPRFKADNGGQVIPEPRRAGRTACAAGKNRDRAARFAQPPAAEVEEMNRLFERPASDSLRVVAPTGSARPVG